MALVRRASPEVAIVHSCDVSGFKLLRRAFQVRRDRSSNLDAARVMLRCEDALICSPFTWKSFRNDLAGPVFVAVKVVDPYRLEISEKRLAHDRMRLAGEKGSVRDKRDDAELSLFADANLGQPKEPD